MPFNFSPGSKESLEFLRVLRSVGRHLYLSDTAQAIVTYKNLQVFYMGIAKLFLYCLFLTTINLYAEMWVMTIWLVFYSIIELVQLKGIEFNYYEHASLWNLIDLSRVFLIASYMIVDYQE
jgi:hypothetical protein